MADWARVKWSEARQVLNILGKIDPADEAAASGPPSAYFDYLRKNGRLFDAAKFLGQALPRLEAVAWAARSVRDLTPADADRDRPEARALRAALLWVGDPTESRRRAAYEAAEACESGDPEALAALAAFFSGGSIAPPDLQVLPAPRDAAGRFAAGAVMTIAVRQKDIDKTLSDLLDAGALIAAKGVDAAVA